jgi:hypothetical protein
VLEEGFWPQIEALDGAQAIENFLFTGKPCWEDVRPDLVEQPHTDEDEDVD